MAGPRHPGLSWAQTAVLACVLSVVVYYLSSNACPTEPHADFHPQTASSSQINSASVQQLRPQGGAGSGKLHVLVTGGAGFIGSHAALRLLDEGHAVTVLDNLSRGNPGAIDVLRENSSPALFQFVNLDLGDKHLVLDVFRKAHFDLVMHFAAVAYVGESMEQPLRYYHNITANTVNVLEAMLETGVKKLVFSSTCATYGNPDQLPVTEDTPTKPINPYGMAKLMAEKQIRDLLSANGDMYAIILRYFNVYGSDPAGQLGEYPRPELRHHGRISGACMDAALGLVPQLTLLGTNHPTPDGTTIRDYIHVSDLVDAHVLGMSNLANPPALYNVGTGKGVSLREFIEACKTATGKAIKVVEEKEARPGDYAAVYSDVAKIHKELGWQAKYTNLLEGLQHAWSWRSKHPNGY